MSLFILGLGSALSAWFSERPKAQLTPELLDKILNLAMTEGGFTAALRMLNALGGAEQFEGFFGGLSFWPSIDPDEPLDPPWISGGPLRTLRDISGRGSVSVGALVKGDPLLSLLWMANARRLEGFLRAGLLGEAGGDYGVAGLSSAAQYCEDISTWALFTQENFGVFEKGIPSEMRLRRAVIRLEFIASMGHCWATDRVVPRRIDYEEVLDLAVSPQDGSEPWVSTHDLEEFLKSDWLTRDSGWGTRLQRVAITR